MGLQKGSLAGEYSEASAAGADFVSVGMANETAAEE
jgi:hypothetical protein